MRGWLLDTLVRNSLVVMQLLVVKRCAASSAVPGLRLHQYAAGEMHAMQAAWPHQRVLGVEQVDGQRLGQLGLADAGGAQEHEGCDGALRIAQPRPRPAKKSACVIYQKHAEVSHQLCTAYKGNLTARAADVLPPPH